ncbi:MAG: MBL fold metallo-hydrolase [Flavobacteriales bacterium CG11_big_fil_rev_8_21_14_0_20_35_7]|nr:MAG: MBL fold metallo-hydrolase [Flavobacteriales bacterium CG11_big_fil_rev_8_21_14_0_20_35_7]
MMKLTFFGGAGTVTGSKILLETETKKLLIDCGLFQGLKELRLKNWEEFPVEFKNIDEVFLTHAHLDHSGYLPILTKNGYKGAINCTQATKELTEIILIDSAKIQEEDSARANKYGYTKHQPAKPLYKVEEVKQCLSNFKTFALNQWHRIDKNIKFKLLNSGHILGSSFIILDINGKIIVFSGDLGRKEPLILHPHQYIENADYVIVESTYGNRNHEALSAQDKLLEYIKLTFSKGGILAIPTFSVERAQEIIYLLSQLKQKQLLPNIPIYLDSPMGVNATNIYFAHKSDHKLTNTAIENMQSTVQLISNIETSKAIVNDENPKIVLAGSGMVTGGRILHYLNKLISDKKNTVLIVGYQAVGTRGRALLAGDSEIKFFGNYHKVNAEIFKIDSFSGHADQSELLDWLQHFKTAPKLTFINHGEPHQSEAFKVKIKTDLKWNCTVAKMNEVYYLD